jgi:hypothetical protein
MSVNNESEWLGSLISSVPESQLWTETMAVGSSPPLRQHPVEGVDEEVGSGPVDAKGRLHLEYVHPVTRRLDHDTQVEHPIADGACLTRRRIEGGPVAYQLYAQVKAVAVDRSDDLVSLRQLFETRLEMTPDVASVSLQVLVTDDVEHGETDA